MSNKISISAAIAAIIYMWFSLSLSGCAGSGSSSHRDTVAVEHYDAAGEQELTTEAGVALHISATVAADVPVSYASQQVMDDFYAAYVKFVFSGDSVGECAAPQVAARLCAMLQERLRLDSDQIGTDDYDADCDSLGCGHNHDSGTLYIKRSAAVTFPYNACGVVSVCRSVSTELEGDLAATESSYLNYDLVNNRLISNSTMFSEENFAAIVALIRARLVKDLGVESEQQLYELGYFNVDNITLTENFTFTPTGVVWVYMPLEIGCFATGETAVEIGYDSLVPYLLADSVQVPVFEF